MLNPLVSIIIPNYNREKVIGETLESLMRQTYDKWEAIIVDDGSSDNSLEIIKAFELKSSKIKVLIRNRVPKGPSVCRNIGVQRAKGKYLIFLDSDDILADFCLEKRMKYILAHQNLDFAVFNIVEFNNVPGDITGVFTTHCDEFVDYLTLFLNNTIPWGVCSPIWKKEFFTIIGGFDEDMVFMEDPELHTRALLTQKVKFYVLSKSTPDVYYRRSTALRFKEQSFIMNSIRGRIQYLKKTCYMIECQSINNKQKMIQDLRQTLINLLVRFVYPNINDYKIDFLDIIFWAKIHKIISFTDYLLIRLLGYLWLNNSAIIQHLRLKGIIRKLIDPSFE